MPKDKKLVRIITPFVQNLLVLPRSLEELRSLLQQSGIVEKMRVLLEWLPKDLGLLN